MISKKGMATAVMATFGMLIAAQSALAQNRMVPAVAFGDEEKMIQVLATEESEIPGYVHQKYIVRCGAINGDNLVDHYGPAISVDDPELIQKELRFCRDDRDGDSSDNSGD
jgi:hypothetical protein